MREDGNSEWPRETGGPSSEVMDTLAHVLRDQEERKKKRTGAPLPREARHHSRILLVLLLLPASLSVYLWAFSPGWLSAPASQPPSRELLEAGARMEVYLAALRIRAFLPPGFSFQGAGYLLDYDNWSGMGNSKFDIGLTYITPDAELGRAALEMLGSNAWTPSPPGSTPTQWFPEAWTLCPGPLPRCHPDP